MVTNKQKAEQDLLISTQSLAADSLNPRKMTEEQAKGLRQSLKRSGDLSGITFNLTTQQLVTGHQRIQQIREQWGECTIDRVDETSGVIRTPAGDFPVRYVRWSRAMQRAANVTANNQLIQGRFDETLEAYVLEDAAAIEEESPGLMNDVLLAALVSGDDDDSNGIDMAHVFQVVVECKDEDEQARAFELLEKHDFRCKVLTQ